MRFVERNDWESARTLSAEPSNTGSKSSSPSIPASDKRICPPVTLAILQIVRTWLSKSIEEVSRYRSWIQQVVMEGKQPAHVILLHPSNGDGARLRSPAVVRHWPLQETGWVALTSTKYLRHMSSIPLVVRITFAPCDRNSLGQRAIVS
jgi:hypothetical protein